MSDRVEEILMIVEACLVDRVQKMDNTPHLIVGMKPQRIGEFRPAFVTFLGED